MQSTTNIHNAKTHLSQLVQKAYDGEEIVICKAGKPMAKLVKFTASDKPRKLGGWKGKVWISEDFYDDKDIVDSFYNSKIFPD